LTKDQVCLYSFYWEKTSVDKPLLEYMNKKLKWLVELILNRAIDTES